MAGLTLNMNAKQAEAMLVVLKAGFEAFGKSADNATQKSKIFAQELQRGLAGIKTAKLQGSLKGVSKSLAEVKRTSIAVSEGMAAMAGTLKWTGIEYEKVTTQAYKKIIATEAETMVVKMLDAQYSKHAKILAETAMIERGHTQTMREAMAVDKARLVTLKFRDAALVKENGIIKLLTISQNQLNASRAVGHGVLVAPAFQTLVPIDKNSAKNNKNLDTYSKTAKKATTSTKALSSAQRGLATATGANALAYGSLVPLMAAFAGAASYIGVQKAGAEFEYTTQYLVSIANNTQKAKIGLDDVKESLLAIKGVAHTPAELAEGVKLLVKAGFPAAQAIREIADMSRFATVAEMEMGKATELVRSQLSAWGKDVGTLEQTANMMAMAASSSAMSLQELGGALRQTTELAVISGISYHELLAGLGKLADMGIKGSMAGSALRTAIIRLGAPASAVSKHLQKLGKTMDIFKPSGEFKGFIQMFQEVERVTATMTDSQRIKFFKDLFGLRQMKGGAGIARQFSDAVKEGTLSMSDLADQIQKAGEELTFLDTIFNDLSETVKLKAEFMKAAWGKALTKAFNSEPVANFLDALTALFESEGFGKGLERWVEKVNEFLNLFTQTAKVFSFWTNLGDVIEKHISKVKILIWLYERLKGFGDKAADVAMGSNPMTMGSIQIKNAIKSLIKLKDKFDWLKSKIEKSDIIVTIKEKFTIRNPLDWSHYTDRADVRKKEVRSIEEWKQAVHKSLNSVKDGFKDYEKSLRVFRKETKEAWDAVEEASHGSVQEQLNDMWILRNAWDSINNNTQIQPKFGIKKSGLMIDGKEVESAYIKYRTVAQKFYYDVGRMAYDQKARESAALDAYVEKYKIKASEMVGIASGIASELATVMNKPINLDQLNTDEIVKLGLAFNEAAGVSKAAFDSFFKDVEAGIDNLIAKEKKLLSEISGYSKDMGDASKTAGKARFDTMQKYRSEAIKYAKTIERINELNKKGSRLGKLAGSLSGDARREMYGQAKSAFDEALSLSNQLTASEENGITKTKARGDALKAIEEYEKRTRKLAGGAKDAAVKELQNLQKKKKELESVGEAVKAISETLGKIHTLKLDSKEAYVQLEALQGKLAGLFDNLKVKVDVDTKAYSADYRKEGNVYTNVWSDEVIGDATTKLENNIKAVYKEVNGVWTNEWEKLSEESGKTLSKELDDVIKKSLKDVEMNVKINVITKNAAAQSMGGPAGLPGFASGSRLPGYGGGDIIPAWLEPGEWIIKKEAVAMMGDPYMKNLNDMKLKPQMMSAGGAVASKAPSHSEEDVVSIDINLPGDGRPVRLRGTRDDVQEFARQAKTMQRFASQ